jgi:hypothetical protein
MANFIIRHKVKKTSMGGKKKETHITSVFVQANSESEAQTMVSNAYVNGDGITYAVSFDV